MKMQRKSKTEITNILLNNKESRENFSFRVTADRVERYKELAEQYKAVSGKSIKLGEIGDVLMDEMNALLESAIDQMKDSE